MKGIAVLATIVLTLLWLCVFISDVKRRAQEYKYLQASNPNDIKYRLIVYKRMLKVMIKSNISPGYCFALSLVQSNFKYEIELFPELYAIKKLRTTEDSYWFPCEDLEIRIKYLKEVIKKTERNAA